MFILIVTYCFILGTFVLFYRFIRNQGIKDKDLREWFGTASINLYALLIAQIIHEKSFIKTIMGILFLVSFLGYVLLIKRKKV